MNAIAEHRHADVTASPTPAQRARLLERLRAILPADALLHGVEDTRPFECEGLSAFRQLPMAVALPENEGQVRVECGTITGEHGVGIEKINSMCDPQGLPRS